jgi:serine/threonine protein kinase
VRDDGLLLGRYRVLQRLGAGGFGVVWRAYDEQLRREVAIKRVLRDDADSERSAAAGRWRKLTGSGDRAEREALATARLAHPAIAALYESRASGQHLYLISELACGQPLHEALRAGALDDSAVLSVGVAVGEALEHAHERGVIHRDVKPANIIVLDPAAARREHVPAKLTDFGSARINGDDGLTHTGDVLGTLAYMAPEQSEGAETTPQTDLYALALTLYEALAGANPMRGPTPAATARRLGTTVAPLEQVRPDLDRTVTGALDRALTPDAQARGTVAELRTALERWPYPARARRPQRRFGSPGRRRPRDARTRERTRSAADISPVALPRVIWWAAALATVLWQGLDGHPGLALVLGAMAAPLIALPRRAGPGWLAAVGAPALGAIGLAGAFPALAGQGSRWADRARLAALGYWWLTVAGLLVRHQLWLWPWHHAHVTAPAGWTGSMTHAFRDVLLPLLTAATAEGLALWAVAAILLPLVVRGHSAARDIPAATVWAALLSSATPLLDSGIDAAQHPTPRGLVLGTALGAAFAVCARALRVGA